MHRYHEDDTSTKDYILHFSRVNLLTMTLLESIRRKFTNNLHLHEIEDDYTTPSRASHSQPAIITENTLDPYYDPHELVPSYEVSQRLHEGNRRNLDISIASGVGISRLGSSNNISRQYANESSELSVSNSNNHNRKNAKRSLKQLGLKFLNARQHFALACCRDISLIPCIFGLYQSWTRAFLNESIDETNLLQLRVSITAARSSEHFLTGVWCIVAGYLSFSVLDGLMLRWIVTYLTSAAIVRMLSMSTIIISIEQYLVATFSAEGYKYGLHIWILISCCLTLLYIVQNFVTSNLDLKGKRKARFFDFYNIVVFAVVPVGLASFITMIGLLRSLLILRLDIDLNQIII